MYRKLITYLTDMLASLIQATYTQLILVIKSIFSIQLNLDKEDE